MLKRTFDVLGASLGLLLFSPLLATLAVAIKLNSPGPVFYRGLRVGLHGRPFRIVKFRSMIVDAEKLGAASTADGDARITSIGRLLRKTKLDELPQLLNVLTGDMSFVGPRPEVQRFVDMYTEEEKAILTVRPGITDWASLWNPDEGAVLAGSDEPDRAYVELIRPQKLRWQLEYVRRRSLLVDITILAQTVATVLWRRTPPALLDVRAGRTEGGRNACR
jgi:lipopolysaccharide/colanic/teichoic acid biosynthesis glycosyltransferase